MPHFGSERKFTFGTSFCGPGGLEQTRLRISDIWDMMAVVEWRQVVGW